MASKGIGDVITVFLDFTTAQTLLDALSIALDVSAPKGKVPGPGGVIPVYLDYTTGQNLLYALTQAFGGESKPETPIDGLPLDLSARAISDLPSTEDLLGITPLVEALDRLLSHRETKLPLAIAITAPWGAGKSSFMEQLEMRLREDSGRPIKRSGKRTPSAEKTKNIDRSWYTVRFPAWKYEKGERIWAALAKAIYEQPQAKEQMPKVWQRILLRFHLERERRGKLSFWAVVFSILGGLALAIISVLEDLPWEFTTSIASGLTAAIVTASRYWGFVSDPFKRAIDQYASRQDFKDQLGFTYDADREIAALSRVLTTSERAVAVFVDDLDRCRTDQVVEVVEAINQIFNLSPSASSSLISKRSMSWPSMVLPSI